jgi:hypothetical protein
VPLAASNSHSFLVAMFISALRAKVSLPPARQLFISIYFILFLDNISRFMPRHFGRLSPLLAPLRIDAYFISLRIRRVIEYRRRGNISSARYRVHHIAAIATASRRRFWRVSAGTSSRAQTARPIRYARALGGCTFGQLSHCWLRVAAPEVGSGGAYGEADAVA